MKHQKELKITSGAEGGDHDALQVIIPLVLLNWPGRSSESRVRGDERDGDHGDEAPFPAARSAVRLAVAMLPLLLFAIGLDLDLLAGRCLGARPRTDDPWRPALVQELVSSVC